MKKSCDIYYKYSEKRIKEHGKRVLHGKSIVESRLLKLKRGFYLSFHYAVSDEYQQFDFFEDIDIPKLVRDRSKKILKTLVPKCIETLFTS